MVAWKTREEAIKSKFKDVHTKMPAVLQASPAMGAE